MRPRSGNCRSSLSPGTDTYPNDTGCSMRRLQQRVGAAASALSTGYGMELIAVLTRSRSCGGSGR